jgi:hypoxanthine phosphoribosyltransferase
MATANLLASPLVSADALSRRAMELGASIDRDFADREPVLVAVLQGALIFTADLMRAIRGHVQLACIGVSSYPLGTQREQIPVFTTDLNVDIRGRDVLVIEDIVDTGHTLRLILQRLQKESPASLSVATCLDKRVRREVDVPLRYIGFEVPPLFVVGYGLDYSGRYRNLPYVGVLSESAGGTSASG